MTPSELREGMFDGDKTRMIELPYNEKNYDNMFHQIPGRYGQTDRFAISISRVSMLTRDKKTTTCEEAHVKLFWIQGQL